MQYCEEFKLKYLPKSPFERIIRNLENKNKLTEKLGMLNNIYTVSSERDDTEEKPIMEKACYAVEPREKDLALNDVYGVIKSDKQMMLSGAAPFFGPSKKLGKKNRKKKNVVDDNQSSNWDQTFKQALSAKVKNPHYNKSEGKSKVSPNNSVHIIEVVNVADDPASDGSNEILETEKISFENEESSNIECSSENDETLYTEMVDMCNEIEIVNEDDSDLFNDFNYGGGGLRTEFYDMRPETPMDSDQMFRSDSQVSKAESPKKRNVKVTKNERLQMRVERPERPQTRSRRPERLQTRERRSDSRDSSSSLENLASQALKQVSEYQEKISKYLSRIYDIIVEPQEPYDINDLSTRKRRSSEFTALFVRTHLYQIGHTAEQIRTMKDNPVNIMTKVNSLFQLVMQGVQSYLKNLEGFIYNNKPEKLIVLTDYILNAIKVCFERRTCNMEDEGILQILTIVDEIRYCVESCDKHGYLQKSFCGMIKKEQPIKLDNENLKAHDKQMNLEQHGTLMSSRANSRKSDENSLKGTIENSAQLSPTDSFLTNDAEEKLKGSRENSKVRKNVYGSSMKSPYGMPSSPYEIPKMKAKPKVASSRSNLNTTKSSNYGSRLKSSKSTVQNVGLHSDKNDNYKQIKGNPGLHPTKSTVFGTNLQKSKGLIQKPGLHPTKSTVHGLSKNTVQNSKLHATKSTVYEVKKSSSDVSTVMQREMEKKNQLSAIEEDSESDQSSEVGSKKASEVGSKKSSKCESLKKLRFDSDNDSSTSGESGQKSERSSVKSDKESQCVKTLLKNDKKSSKNDKNSSKNDKKSSKNDKKSSEGNQNCPKSDKPHLNIDIPQSNIEDMLKNPQNDLNGIMKMIKNLTKQRFESMVCPMVSKHEASKHVKSPKAEDVKKSIRRVTAAIEPLKKPKSIDSEDSHSSQNESSEEDDDDDLDFSKYTPNELREMAIKEQQMRLERIKQNPLYYQEGVVAPWKIMDDLSEHIIDELLNDIVDEFVAGTNTEDKELIEKFIDSDSDESECEGLHEIDIE